MRKLTTFVLASFIFLTLSSCTGTEEKSLTICGNIPIDPLSTADGTNFFSSGLDDLIFSPLAVYKNLYEIHPVLVESTTTSLGGGSAWEIRLKDGVRFHNGTPLTAEDVAFSIEKGKETSTLLKTITGTDILGERESRLRFDKPLSDITRVLGEIYVYPSRIFNFDAPWRETLLKNPIGTGPYKFKRWLSNGIELEANDGYFEGRPKIKKVVYIYEKDEEKRITRFLKGEADILSVISPKAAGFLEKDNKYSISISKTVTPYLVALFLNNRSPLFSDRRIRTALNMAINRELLIDKGLYRAGVTAHGTFIADMLPEGYVPTPFPYDPQKALQLLKEAGLSDKNGDGILEKGKEKFRFHFYYSTASEEFKRLADLIAQQFYEIGVEVETQPISLQEMFGKKLKAGGYDAILCDISVTQPGNIWGTDSLKGGEGMNLSRYNSNEADDLINQINTAKDAREKRRIHSMLDRNIHEDAPAVFIYHIVEHSVVGSRFKGTSDFKNEPYSFYKIKDMDIGQ